MNWLSTPWRKEEDKMCKRCNNDLPFRPSSKGEMVPCWRVVKDCLPDTDRAVMVIVRRCPSYMDPPKSSFTREIHKVRFNPGTGWTTSHEVVAWRDFTDEEKTLLRE